MRSEAACASVVLDEPVSTEIRSGPPPYIVRRPSLIAFFVRHGPLIRGRPGLSRQPAPRDIPESELAAPSLLPEREGVAVLLATRAVLRYQRSAGLHRLVYTCRFIPSCSEYCVRALRKYGLLRGAFLTIGRLYRCHPSNTGSRVDFP
jgi:putative membrane protein insertion efficiency factor